VEITMISRRAFNTGSGSLLLISLGGIPKLGHAAAGRAIDVHCHVFNVTDVPVRQFIRRVVFEDYERQTFLPLPRWIKGLIAWLISALTKPGVITAKEELDKLNAGHSAIAELVTFDPYSSDFQEIITRSLDEVLPTLDPETARALQEALEQELRAGPNPPQEKITGSQVLSSVGVIGRYFRWAGWLRSPRIRIAARINELYGRHVGVLTPAFLDFTQWLNEKPNDDSTIVDQIAVMEAVQREAQKRFGVIVHSLVPFDPWRQALDEYHNRNPTAFDLVCDAVETKGYLGVKLYPPMGFLPTGNVSANLTYPERSADLPDFRCRIDAALERLYTWAENKDVAIMAHATNSQAAGPGYGNRASPREWHPVLRGHPNLRLNLAHFGGFRADPEPWEDIIGAMLASYPNLYADLSYLSEALPSAPQRQRERIADKLADWIRNNPKGSQRLLYGSDYLMLGREPDHNQFFEAVEATLRKAGLQPEEWSHLARDNAIGFYGLRSGQPARLRLEAWYKKPNVGLDSRVLTQFD
jgi:predicted TIM-barrel fold metal-dependent hydrolase